LGSDDLRAGPGILQRLARLEKLRLLETVGREDGDLQSVEFALRHCVSPFRNCYASVVSSARRVCRSRTQAIVGAYTRVSTSARPRVMRMRIHNNAAAAARRVSASLRRSRMKNTATSAALAQAIARFIAKLTEC